MSCKQDFSAKLFSETCSKLPIGFNLCQKRRLRLVRLAEGIVGMFVQHFGLPFLTKHTKYDEQLRNKTFLLQNTVKALKASDEQQGA